MWDIKKITILLCFLSLVAFISCSAEDKTGSPKPEGDTEIAGETGGSETGGSSGEGGSGSGSGTGESGGSGETGGTETTEEGNFPPPDGTYRDDAVFADYGKPEDAKDTKVSTVDGKITIKGMALTSEGGGRGFGFDISKWKKTTKGEKITKLEAVDIVVETGYSYTDAVIIYYSDTQTLKITFKNGADECSFNGTKQP